MISRGFQNLAHHQGMHMFPVTTEDLVSANSVEVAVNSASGSSSGSSSSSSSSSHSSTLLFNLSVLKDKLSQVQTLVGVILSPDQSLPESTSMAVSSMNSTIQEIIVTASSMMFTCQQMAPSFPSPPGTNELHHQSEQHQRMNHHSSSHNYGTNNNRVVLTTIGTEHNDIRGQGFFTSTESEALDWFGETYNNNNNNNSNSINCKLKGEDDIDKSVAISDSKMSPAGDDDIDENNNVNEGYGGNYDIIELDASDLLAKYTHYCQVCGKGFKRDANLRMHMRAHGDEYKTSAALSNPLKNIGGRDECLMSEIMMKPKKYSCPQQGCRWNKKHAKFQPLKSMICAKNHYKRSHCPKMYVCKRCNQKQFSVLSDLRTHEKHCGDLKWQCSCGTTFSRKDKLMGHVALFVGHTPCPNSTSSTNGIIMLPPFSAGKLQLQNVDGT